MVTYEVFFIKVKVDSFATWTEANVRILQLLQGDKGMTEDYLGYMARISALVANYSWPRVYEYDKKYREVRARTDSRWNTDFPNLSEILFRPGLDSSKVEKSAKTANSTVVTQKKKYCFRFNDTGNCENGDKCKFPHVCRWCPKSHSGMTCSLRQEKKGGGRSGTFGSK